MEFHPFFNDGTYVQSFATKIDRVVWIFIGRYAFTEHHVFSEKGRPEMFCQKKAGQKCIVRKIDNALATATPGGTYRRLRGRTSK